MQYLNAFEPLFKLSDPATFGLIMLMIVASLSWMRNDNKEMRGPLLILVIVVSSGHPLGTTIANYIGLLTLPFLVLAILSFGVWYLIYGAKLLFKRLRNLNPQAQ